MALRDYFIAPPAGDSGGETEADERPSARHFGLRSPLRNRAPASRAVAPSLGVLATERDLPAVAASAGLVMARRAPAVLICLHAPGAELGAAFRVPARPATARLAVSLAARGLSAEGRGRLVFARPQFVDEGDSSAADYAAVDEPAPLDGPAAMARALAAAGGLPTVLGVAVRDPDIDALLAAQDAILVSLPPAADPALAELALAGASELSRSVARVEVALDPVSRALALGGVRAPRGLREAIEGLVA